MKPSKESIIYKLQKVSIFLVVKPSLVPKSAYLDVPTKHYPTIKRAFLTFPCVLTSYYV